MSLIYEALRKSEQQRRAGELPTLATDPAWGVRRTAARRRTPRLRWIAVAAVLAVVGVGAWLAPRFVAQMAPADPRAEQAAANAGRGTAAAAATPASAPLAIPAELAARFERGERFANDPAALLAAVPRPSAPPETPTPVAPAAPHGAGFLTDPRTPTVAGPEPRGAPPPSAIPATEPLQPERPAIVSVQAADPSVAAAEPTAPAPSRIAAREAAARESTETNPAAPALPLVYELPYALRKDLPKLALSMHVYSVDPARRFAIINDERKGEGEAIDGVRIIAIRRDGLELEYAGRRFLLPRSG